MTGRIIHLHGDDPHREVLELLPWHVTGQLDAEDADSVEAHLQACAACRAALAVERRLDREIVRVPTSVDAGWANMRQRLDLDHAPVAAAAPRPRASGRDSSRASWFGADGWRLGWPAGVLVPWQSGIPVAFASLAALLLLLPPANAPAEFKALGTTTPPNETYIVVKFRPETSETVFRQTLQANAARLIDGPTVAGAYVVAVPAATRPAVLERLRHQPQVMLAQPIDTAARP